MRLLIDGYNLLHATDLFGAGALAGTLRGSREALVRFLAERLTDSERRATVIVFDANDAPPGLPDTVNEAGMVLRFARGYPDADALIEHLLGDRRRRKGLTVVSGDRRVQRAARSCGATPVESSAWFADLCARPQQGAATETTKPTGSYGSPREWVDAFSDPEDLQRIAREAAAAPMPPPTPEESPPPTAKSTSAEPVPSKSRRGRTKRRPPLSEGPAAKDEFGAGLGNPFPPGYAEDLLRDGTPEQTDRDGRNDRDG